MASFGVGPNPYVVVEDQLTKERWDTWVKSRGSPPANNAAFQQAVQQHYQSAIANQLNNPTPIIRMPPAVANTIEPFKIHVVERYDTDMEVSLILGAFSNKKQAEAYAKANGGWEYTVHEFTLDSEVPVEKQD